MPQALELIRYWNRMAGAGREPAEEPKVMTEDEMRAIAAQFNGR